MLQKLFRIPNQKFLLYIDRIVANAQLAEARSILAGKETTLSNRLVSILSQSVFVQSTVCLHFK